MSTDRRPPISGVTRVAAVIGSPVGHSLSPALHNAAFAALGLDWVYVACEVAPGRAAEAVAAMGAFGLGGLSVTMPHKAAVAALCDEVVGIARLVGTVNAIRREPDGRLVG